ncbi:hypothetical protein RclHR1_01410005 [Rhizophagus clarus]|uniref:F-box domain-containing protein n=1 Tax=Rhizophagus clarus TaxID=94130 RepID=A0A2Z6QG70_9GLOM|nr:hypothetical protein RclHR1_01410005 [Rhizophagus clarus]GES74718.1 hypothetical protein GLOIN_2v1842657 [Rhizophagus clarus]
MSNLNKDILIYIFEELSDNQKSLHSCLLVNRFWCETVVPILWSDVWKFFEDPDESENISKRMMEKYKSLFKIILLYLPKKSSNFLVNQNIEIISTQEKPLFNYLSYIKSIKLSHIYIFANEILGFDNIGETSYQLFAFEQELFKLFMNNCSKLNYLDMFYSTHHLKHQLHIFPGAENCLSRLCELRCNARNDSSFFYGLAQICDSINKFIIEDLIDNPGLARLIKVQKKIQVIDFDHQSDEDDDESFLQDDLRRIGTALKFHAINLRVFSLDFCSKNFFISSILENSINLQKLALSKNLPNERINENIIIRNPCCPKLHTLLLYFVSISLAIKLVERIQGNLIKIGIYFVSYDIENTGNFIKTIYQNCLNIEYVTIIMKNCDFDELEILLIKCQHLKGIIFESIYEGEDINMVNGNKLLNLLIEKSPKNLYKIGFYFNWKFDYNSLDLFFNNWKGRKSLLLETGEKNNFLLNYPGLIEKYESNGVIKNYKHQDELWNSVYIKTVLDL